MHIYANTESIQRACAAAHGSELGDLIGLRIEELAAYGASDLSALVKMIVLEPCDVPAQVDLALGFSLLDRPSDAAESHREWYELTLVLSDDGFGVVIYVPKHPDLNQELKDYCIFQMGVP